MRLRLRPSRFPVRAIAKDRRSATAVELALILPVFLAFLLMLFEVAYDQFLQGALESALQFTAYQMQVGIIATANPASGSSFITTNFCPNALGGVLNCNSLYVRVQQYNPNTCTDFYSATQGTKPVVAGVLQLGYYSGVHALPGGNNTQVGPTACELNSSGGPQGVGFCNAGPNQYIIMTAVYVAPSFLQELIPGNYYTFGGNLVRAELATSAFYTENFTAPSNLNLPC